MHSRILRIIRLFGPAWIVMLADMDASSIIGAAQLGAIFQYGFIWFLMLLVIPLYFVQEASGRIGAVTGEGLGATIRKYYSKRIAAVMTIPMFLTDIVTYVAEFLGIAIGLEILGVPIIFGIAVAYIVFLWVVTRNEYEYAEKVLLVISGILILGLLSTLLLRGVKAYPLFAFNFTHLYLFMIAATVGAVVMPFMLFFQASATSEKMKEMSGKIPVDEVLKESKENTFVGAIVTELLMIVVEMTFSGIPNAHSGTFASAQSFAGVLQPIAGSFSPYVFGIGLMAAGFLALVVVALASAWGVAEALKIKNKTALFIMESLPAFALAILLPPSSLISSVMSFLVVFVFVLIGPVIILGMIAQNKKIMGQHAFSRGESVAYWCSSLMILAFGIASAIFSLI